MTFIIKTLVIFIVLAVAEIYACPSGVICDGCVETAQFCDGVARCDNCADELFENCESVECNQDSTRCGDDSQQCIANQMRCDGTVDCVNGWDERNDTCGGRDPAAPPLFQLYTGAHCPGNVLTSIDYLSQEDCIQECRDTAECVAAEYGAHDFNPSEFTCKLKSACDAVEYESGTLLYRYYDSPPPISNCYTYSLEQQDPYGLTYGACFETVNYQDYSHMTNVVPVRELFDEPLCVRAVWAHNWARSLHISMTRVIWDPLLAAEAEANAMEQAHMILYGTDPPTDAFVTNSFYGSGNDYIDITRTYSMEHAVFNWYNDGRKCNYLIERNLRRAGCSIDNFKKVVSDGRVEIGCGASFFVMETLPHLIVTCHYNMTDATGVVTSLQPGTQFPANYDVMQEYEILDYPEHSLGCDGPGRTCWPTYCL